MLTEGHRSPSAARAASRAASRASPPPPAAPAATAVAAAAAAAAAAARAKRPSRRARSRDSSRSTPRRERTSLLRRRRRSPTPSSYDSYDSSDSESFSSGSAGSRSASPRRARYSRSPSSYSRSRSRSRSASPRGGSGGRRRRRRRAYSPRGGGARRHAYRRRRYTRTPPPRRARDRSPRRKRPRAPARGEYDARGCDARTVFVWQLAKRVCAEDVFDLFSDAGRVRDVRLVMDRYSSRHKSAGYVEFYDQRAVERAINMSGVNLCGVPVAVRRISPRVGAGDAAAAAAGARGVAGDEPYARERRSRARPHERAYEAGGGGGGGGGGVAPPSNSIGWSTRRPIRSTVDKAGALVRTPPAPAPPAPTGLTRELVSIDELKRLLNPNKLPVTAAAAAKAGAPADGAPNGARAARGGGEATAADGGEREAGGADGAARRIYVGSIAYNVSESELRALFEPYGKVQWLQLQREANGRSKGFAFVEFERAEEARRALQTNGVVVGAKALTVALAAAQTGRTGVVERVPLPLVEVAGEIDEGRSGGLGMNCAQRVMLMQELSRGETMGSKLKGDVHKLKSCAAATRSVVLSNMFDPGAEQAGFEKELLEEVRDECMAKYGKVVHLHVESESHGVVYLRFSRVEEAARARNELSGRWFGGKKIAAAFVDDALYAQRFPGAAAS